MHQGFTEADSYLIIFKVKTPLGRKCIFRAICAGASGYILKSTTPAEYIEALKDVNSGGSPMTSGIARKVFHFLKTMFMCHQNNLIILLKKKKPYYNN